MWVSRRTDYATRAILALSLEGGGPLKLEELARRTAVPQSVLEQVMPTMRTAGVVRSERGPSGGYRLNKDPEEITLERIVRLFQGPLAPISCATRHNPEPCPMMVGCTLRDVWEEVRDATISLLGGVTFADLAKRAGGPGWTRPCSRRKSPSERTASRCRLERRGDDRAWLQVQSLGRYGRDLGDDRADADTDPVPHRGNRDDGAPDVIHA